MVPTAIHTDDELGTVLSSPNLIDFKAFSGLSM
jgi:hypothetical protein